MGLEAMMSARRRRWILLTAIAATCSFTWGAVGQLRDLVAVQQLPPVTSGHTLLELAEHNIASHLHLPLDTGFGARAEDTPLRVPTTTTTLPGGGSKKSSIGSIKHIHTLVSPPPSPPPAKFKLNPRPSAEAMLDQRQKARERKEREDEALGKQGIKLNPRPSAEAMQKLRQAERAEREEEEEEREHQGMGRREVIRPAGTLTVKARSETLETGASVGPNCPAAKVMRNTDFWGDPLVWGTNHQTPTAEDCCRSCAKYKPKNADDWHCNVWVYCEDKALCGAQHRECWLKHLSHPYAASPASSGPAVGWTTGVLEPLPQPVVAADTGETSEERRFHVVISAQGPAVHWQARVHYYWYRKVQKQCEAAGECQMGGWTRILHSGQADDLMEEMPTYVAQTLPPEHPHHGYIVLNRPWAFLQWIRDVRITEKYILMSEPDHVWLKPMPNLMVGSNPAAFPFFYIEPSKNEYFAIVNRLVGPLTRRDTEEIAPVGSAPTMLTWDDMAKVAPLWFNLSIAVHNDEEAIKEWGWVQEMYAFTLAMWRAGVRDVGLHPKMMSQPPWDTTMKPYYLLHFTYGMDYTLNGTFTPGKYGEWRFDKRTYHNKPPPRNLDEPPAGMRNELVRHLIHAINEASSVIPGWDEYARTGVASQHWDGVVAED